MNERYPIHHDSLIHILALPVIYVTDPDGPLTVLVTDELTFEQRSLIHLGGPAIRENEDLWIFVALFDLLVNEEAIIGLVDLGQKEKIGSPTALQTYDMRVFEIAFVLRELRVRVARVEPDSSTQDPHLGQNVIFGTIFCDVVHLGPTETGLRKTSGIHTRQLWV